MVFTTLGIMIVGTDITRTIIRITDIITDMVIILTMVIIIITDTITTTTDIIRNHVVKDMLLQVRWVATETIINHIIKHIVVVMCQHQQRLRKMLSQPDHKVSQHIIKAIGRTHHLIVSREWQHVHSIIILQRKE